jgi:hypothetical protein
MAENSDFEFVDVSEPIARMEGTATPVSGYGYGYGTYSVP